MAESIAETAMTLRYFAGKPTVVPAGVEGGPLLPAAATSRRPRAQAVLQIVSRAAGAALAPRLMLMTCMRFWMHQSMPEMIWLKAPLPALFSTFTA